MRRVTGQQDPPLSVLLGMPGLEGEPRQPDRFGHRPTGFDKRGYIFHGTVIIASIRLGPARDLRRV